MRSFSWILLLIYIFGCSSNPSSEILVPTVNKDFYQEALKKVEAKLEDDPQNLKLIEQQLFYCKAAGWPSTCSTSLNATKNSDGMSESLFNDFFEYYTVNGEYEALTDLVDVWRELYSLSIQQHQTLIKSYTITNRKIKAIQEISDFLRINNDKGIHEFVATQYLNIGDTLKSIYYMSKVRKSNPTSPLMITYGKLLVERGYAARGIDALEDFATLEVENKKLNYDLAIFYDKYGYTSLARNKLRRFTDGDTISFYVAELFKKEGLLDSAILLMDSVLSRDSVNLIALKNKASLYNQKGWLSTALSYYEEAFAIDPNDTTISDQIADIQRKIAYLQRKKFEENKAPLLELNSKKIINE